ncbi:MAG: hypothetical protein KKA07_13625 [Bacteroidetes bacterium]|nr:hypothetical protein [Bacteroidota bacterium]MBU1720100.1 hypothetical protein [Bacteroidota bacterium]
MQGKTQYLWLLLFMLMALISENASSQDYKATMALDSADILIGDHARLSLKAVIPAKSTLLWPDFGDTLAGQIEIISKTKIDTTHNTDGSINCSQVLTITSYDSGYYALAPFSCKVVPAGGSDTMTLMSDAILFSVRTMAVDTTKDFKDIKGPLGAPWTLREAMPYILYTLAGLVVIFLIWFIWRKLRKKEPILKLSIKPSVPAHVRALKAFKALEEKKLWQNNRVKEYYIELTEIVRQYIEERFDIIALELTSEEILAAMRTKEIDESLQNMMRFVFITADFVKFAKATPLPDEHSRCLTHCVSFVNLTIPETNVGEEKTGN